MMYMVPPVYVKCYARHFIQGISFNPHKNLMRQILLLSSFHVKRKRLREGKEFVQGHTTSK